MHIDTVMKHYSILYNDFRFTFTFFIDHSSLALAQLPPTAVKNYKHNLWIRIRLGYGKTYACHVWRMFTSSKDPCQRVNHYNFTIILTKSLRTTFMHILHVNYDNFPPYPSIITTSSSTALGPGNQGQALRLLLLGRSPY